MSKRKGHLIIRRNIGQSIRLTLGDQEILIALIEARPNGRTTLGFRANEAVKILRTELLDEPLVEVGETVLKETEHVGS